MIDTLIASNEVTDILEMESLRNSTFACVIIIIINNLESSPFHNWSNIKHLLITQNSAEHHFIIKLISCFKSPAQYIHFVDLNINHTFSRKNSSQKSFLFPAGSRPCTIRLDSLLNWPGNSWPAIPAKHPRSSQAASVSKVFSQWKPLLLWAVLS